MKDVGKLFCHLVYFTAVYTFYGYLVYFGVILVYIFRFGMLYREKSGNPELLSASLLKYK
jgi:hypothetical protein